MVFCSKRHHDCRTHQTRFAAAHLLTNNLGQDLSSGNPHAETLLLNFVSQQNTGPDLDRACKGEYEQLGDGT